MPRAKGGSIPPPRVNVEPNHGGVISDLNENDVLCGRGGRINNHPGNITFRVLVEEYKREYLDPRTRKLEKAHVAARLVAQIRSSTPSGRFLKDDPSNAGMYFEIGDAKAWKKAGQALREDAPDVRKEIGEVLLEATAIEDDEKQNDHNKLLLSQPPQHQPSSYDQNFMQHQQQQQQNPHPVLPHGIPPSVSYSPTSGPGPAAGGGGTFASMPGSRPDPPEAPGVTGYRQPPLRYFESGRGSGGGSVGGGGAISGRGGRGHPPQHVQTHHQQQQQQQQQQTPPHQYNAHPPQQGYHHPPHFYQPPYNHQQFIQYGQPPQHHHLSPPFQYQHQPPPQLQHRAYPNPQSQPYNSHQVQQQQQQQVVGKSEPHPQFSAPPNKHSRKLAKSASPDRRSFAGTTYDMLYATNHSSGSIFQGQHGQDCPRITSAPGTKDFSDSDVCAFGRRSSETSEFSCKSLSREEGSFAMSDILGIKTNQSWDNFLDSKSSLGRTRSFPDLTLSSDDLLPPLPTEGEHAYDLTSWANEGKEKLRTTSRERMMRPFHRHTSSQSSNQSMTSLTVKGFHPIRSRSNTAVSGINDAMSIMSLDSRKSVKSDTLSWLDNFHGFQSIHSDMNPWEAPMGEDRLVRPAGDEGSLSDVSYDLTALDLAEPLLPPLMMNDSYDFMKPDP